MYFIGFVLLCAPGTPECTKDKASFVYELTQHFANAKSAGFAGVACQQAAVAYARTHFDPGKNRIGIACEYHAK